MPNRSADELFQLIRSLTKAEKRAFKLFAQRHSASTDLKMIQLFDAMDSLDSYEETLLLKKAPSVQKKQLANMKAHLYRQILAGLRTIKDDTNIDMLLHEQLDYARILYNKGLYLQTLKALARIKEIAREKQQITFLLQALIFEKKIEALYITRSFADRAESIAQEVNELNDHLQKISTLSNLSLQLYGWYIQHGHAGNRKEVEEVRDFFYEKLPEDAHAFDHFYEKLYYQQCYAWYTFILQDFPSFYRHTYYWVQLFLDSPRMIPVERMFYIKGMHNLLIAHFMLRNGHGYAKAMEQFEKFGGSADAFANENIEVQTFIYLSIARINQHFLEGTFTEGLKLIPRLEEKLEDYELRIDPHRILVFQYKIACLYFGHGDSASAIDYLNRIINWKVDLRSDLQCYARLLHLICHYELGNEELMEYLVRSTYRFMAKLQHLSKVEQAIFRFLRESFHFSAEVMNEKFTQLKSELEEYQDDPLQSRSFMYLDIISWLESKIHGKPVQQVIQEKYLNDKKRNA